MGMIIEPASKERTEQGEQFIERLLKILQNNDKVTVNIMYCQTCVIDSLASIDSGTSYNAGERGNNEELNDSKDNKNENR